MSVVVRGLRKSYGRHIAVDGVSFEAPSGALFAFLGTNGAGKSTTIGCLTTILTPDGGTVEIDGLRLGRDDARVRRRIGVVFQASLLDPLLTVRENLDMRAALYRMAAPARRARIAELSELLSLGEFIDRRYRGLSGGQRRRADIARALLHDPAVLFLDEPTSGLDPQSRDQVWRALRDLRSARGTTVFLTTHYMEETEASDAVCIIDHGRIVAEGTPAALRRRHSSSVLTVTFADDEAAPGFFAARGLHAERTRERYAIEVDSAADARAILADAGSSIADFEFRHGTMDDVFLALTGGPAE